MKVATILGTRPEIIRLSRVIPRLDSVSEQVLIHTGQNFDFRLNEIFFEQLNIRQPDFVLGCKGQSAMAQVGQILLEVEKVLSKVNPDRVLLLGDTNSALAAIAAKRMNIPVYHMEAGNRCFDDRVPEEVNRRIVDHTSDILMPYTERSRANLLREGIPSSRIYVTGNPIKEVLDHYDSKIESSLVLSDMGLQPGHFFLVTLHRAENVDVEARLKGFMEVIRSLPTEFNIPVICSLHPRTRDKMAKSGIKFEEKSIRFVEPLGLFDFVKLEKNAACVLSDSGTVQEECCIFGVRNVTLRDVTERPETVEAGSNLLTGGEPKQIVRSIRAVMDSSVRWKVPQEYLATSVSETVTRIILNNRSV